MNIWQPEHPHHAVWREYTQSFLDGKPKSLEVNVGPGWQSTSLPSWDKEYQYRIARPVLTVSYTVPMPVKEALEVGQDYWLAGSSGFATCRSWYGHEADSIWLKKGRIHLTREDAQAAIDARNAAYGEALK